MVGERKIQEEWFYDEGWTAEMESELVDQLLDLKELSVWAVGKVNEDVVEIVCSTVNTLCGTNKTVAFLNEKNIIS